MTKGFEFADFHCHILPGADHGSDSLETSLSQARHAVAAGVTRIVATPHYYPSSDTVPEFLERRARTFAELQEGLDREQIPLSLIPGGEVALSPELPDEKDLDKLCIGNSRYLLLELPLAYWTNWVFDAIYRIESYRQLTPIIAHVDRYEPKMVEKLFDMSLFTQINASSLLDFSSRRRILRWAQDGSVHFLGSDTHGDGEKSFDGFVKASEYLTKKDPHFMMRPLGLFDEIRGGETL